MKSSRNLPQLEEFEAYRPAAAALARSHKRRYAFAETLSDGEVIASRICRFIAAAIMIETLFFKFTGAPESVYIFSKMGMESWWRYGQGIWELLAATLLLARRFSWAGGILTLGALGAAIVSHITILGIEIQGDHGLLFGMAVVTFVSGLIVTYLHRREIPSYTPSTSY